MKNVFEGSNLSYFKKAELVEAYAYFAQKLGKEPVKWFPNKAVAKERVLELRALYAAKTVQSYNAEVKTKTVRSISFVVYNNSLKRNKHIGDAEKYVMALFNTSIEQALRLKAELAMVPNIGSVININLSNGNHL